MIQIDRRKAAACANLKRARARWEQLRFRRPPRGTPEYKHYRKLRDTLGTERARREMEARQ